MKARWWTRQAELAAGAERWDAGVRAAGGDNPYVLSTFLRAWSEAFADEDSLRMLVVEGEDGAIVAGWPLVRQRRRHAGVGCWALRPLGLGFANLNEPFYRMKEEEFALVAAGALGERDDWDYVSLPLARATWWEGAGWRWRRRAQGGAARFILDRPADGRGLSPHMQANLRRCLRRAEEMGGARLERVGEAGQLQELIAFQLRHNGPQRYPPEREWGAAPERWAEFTGTLLRRLHAAGQLDAMALRLGGELAAVGFGFRHGPGYKSMLTSFDPRCGEAGPGLLLFHFLMDWCRKRGDPWIDMYAEAAHLDKRRWQPEVIPLHHGFIFAGNARGRALFQMHRMRG